jgi:predicted amidohydrolase YtcJ
MSGFLLSRVIFASATVVDADGARGAMTVVVEGRRITAVRPDQVIESGPEDRVVDLGGRTLMPGMVSSHFHATSRRCCTLVSPEQ